MGRNLMDQQLPQGYQEVKLGETVPPGALYLSTTGHWEESPVYDCTHVNKSVRFAKKAPPEAAVDGERWETI